MSIQRTVSGNAANEPIEETIVKVKKTESSLRDALTNSQEYTRVILIGRTGASKSTISNALIGKPLRIAENDCGDTYLIAEGSEFDIGNTNISTTTIPNIYVDHQNKFLICDAPGFDDTRGPSQDMINSFAIDQLFKSPCKIKILFVFAVEEADVIGRGFDLLQTVKRLYEIFPNEKELEDCLGVIVSRGDGSPPEKYIKNQSDGNPDMDNRKFCNFCLNNLNDRVFNFPLAKSKNVGDLYNFEDREKVIKFLKNNPVENPSHKIVLSDQSKFKVSQVLQQLENFDDLLRECILRIRQIYITDDSGNDELNLLKDIYSRILNELERITTPTDFAVFLQTLIQNQNIEEILNKIKCLHNLNSFMENIVGFEKSIQLLEFKRKVSTFIDEEIMKIDTIISIKAFEKDLQKNYQENEEVKNRISNLELTVEQKEEARKKLKIEMEELLQKIQNQDRVNSEELAKMHESFNEKLFEYQCLIDEKNKDNLINEIANWLGPIGILFKGSFYLGEKIDEFFS